MKSEFNVGAVSLLFALGIPAWANDVAIVRSVEKTVLVSRAGSTTAFNQAHLKQGLAEDQHLRTLKRSKAMLGFTDGAQLRVNERTELVIKPSPDLKRLELGAGAVWLKVPKGQRLVVETPTVTAAVRGTEFEVTAEGEVRVYDGVVEVSKKPATSGVAVGAGEFIKAGQTTPRQIPGDELPSAYGGGEPRWWEGMIPDRENLTSSDGPAFAAVQASNYLFRYRNEERGRPIDSKTESVYRDRFDVETDATPWTLLAGGLGFAATDISEVRGVALHGGAGPFFGMPSVVLGDVRYGFSTQRSSVRGMVESRAYFNRKTKWETHLLSELGFAVRISDKVTAFSGRSYLSSSPAPVDTLGQNIVSDRFSSVGLTSEDGPWRMTGAWLYDTDPWIARAQSAVAVSATRFMLGGQVTATYIHRADEPGRGGLGFVMPVLPTKLEFYGELSVSRGATGSNATIGAYFPSLFELGDVDFFVEYQSRKRVGTAWTFYGSHKISTNWSIFSHLEWIDSHHTCGVGMSLRF